MAIETTVLIVTVVNGAVITTAIVTEVKVKTVQVVKADKAAIAVIAMGLVQQVRDKAKEGKAVTVLPSRNQLHLQLTQ